MVSHDLRNNGGLDALMQVAARGDAATVTLLARHWAALDQTDRSGRSALQHPFGAGMPFASQRLNHAGA